MPSEIKEGMEVKINCKIKKRPLYGKVLWQAPKPQDYFYKVRFWDGSTRLVDVDDIEVMQKEMFDGP
jgi:hypothetical protein